MPVYVARVGVGLAQRGHEVVASGPAGAAVRGQLEAGGVRYVPAPWDASVPAPKADLATLRALGSLIRETRPDVVHAHGQKAGLLARAAAHRARVPAVYTPHSFVYRTQLARPRRGRRLRYALNLRAERALGGWTAMIAAIARDEADAAVRDRIVDRDRTRVVECAVTIDASAAPDPALAAIPGDGPLFGIVSALRDQKGLPDLLEALELLASEGRPVRFAIVGDGPMAGFVTRRLATGALAETTRLLPFAGHVEPYLAGLDAFVLPSLWEGLPISVVEAMAMGLPVVATAVNGTPEVVQHGHTGLLVSPGDPPALAGAIATLAADPSRRAAMGAAGREVAERFTVERAVQGTEAVYRAVVGG